MGLALLCPGQGRQSAEMFAELATWEGAAPALAAIRDVTAIDPFAVPAALASAPDLLFTNANAQPLIVGHSLAAHAALASSLPPPAVILGYSVGELAAHAMAGALPLREAIELAAARADTMDRAVAAPQGMLALDGLPLALIEQLAEACGCQVAIVNGSDHAVLGGSYDAIGQAEAMALARKVPKVRRLQVTVASHTPALAPAVDVFRGLLEKSGIRNPRVPVIAGVDALPVLSRDRAVDTLSRQIAAPLLWSDSVEVAIGMGARAFLELGPGRSLTKMLEASAPDLPARALEDFRTPEAVVRWVERHA